ncbi:DUF1643 domain-containing protein [Yoonia sp. SS1-5]|uniref:DUF1643 domain-containing protein n=1 Tax=Yoonia rhodophyticola TaxID=3137370 RepID=A0AAN0MBC3_9RHOB
MITRTHHDGTTSSVATYSDCQRYRYALTRRWDPAGQQLLYIMLNPSRATEIDNDPTIERCQRRATQLGFGAFQAVNIFAWRETDPRQMRRAADPVGPENDQSIRDAVAGADMILAAWGTHGAHMGRGPAVAGLLRALGRPVHVLGLTKAGHPRHPLYVTYAQQPILWHINQTPS